MSKKYKPCTKCGRLVNTRAPNTHQCSHYIARVLRNKEAEARMKDENKQAEYAALRILKGA